MNAILDRVIAELPSAFRQSCIRDRHHPLDDIKDFRPDLIVEDTRRVVIVDMAVPFDNREDAMVAAQRRKEDKYADLARRLGARLGKEAKCLALVVVSLGTWHPANEATLNVVRIARGYRMLLRQLCVCDAIILSSAIWSDFSTGRLAPPRSVPSTAENVESLAESAAAGEASAKPSRHLVSYEH